MVYLFDVFLIGIVICLIIIGKKVGFARMILEFLRGVFSYILAVWLGKYFADLAYENVLRGHLEQFFTEGISSGVSDMGENLWDSIPDIFQGLLEGIGVSLQKFQGTVDSVSSDAASEIVKIMRPALVQFMSFFFTVFLFVSIFALFGIVIRFVDKTFELPVLSTANGALGGAVGALTGIFAVLVICFIAGSIQTLLNGEAATWLGKCIEQSSIVAFVNKINPFIK